MKNLISLFIIIFVLFAFSQYQCEIRAAHAQADLDIGMPQQISPLEAENSVQVYLSDKIDLFIDSVTWCFDTSCNNQANVDAIGKIIMKYGWDNDNYGVVCILLYEEDGTPYLHLRIVMVSKINPDKRYLHIWEMDEETGADI